MKKVLLVDDDPALRSTLRDMLEELDCEVTEAEDGVKGLAKLREAVPDIVITDIMMPNKEGISTISDIRKTHPSLPIVAMSGGGSTGNTTFLDFAKKLGANRALGKPIAFADLEAVVADLLHGPGNPKPEPVAGKAPL